MRSFDEIWEIAVNLKGIERIMAGLAYPKSVDEIKAIPDDRWLSKSSQMIFNSGFNWKVVENKWPGFEEAFDGFNLDRVAHMNEDDFDALLANKDIIRNGMKLRSVQENAIFFSGLRQEYGSVGDFFALSPPENYVELLAFLKAKASRLGGNTGSYFLRFMGVDSFILSQDVVARLVGEGVVDKSPSSKRDLKKTQDAFNIWRGQSGRSLTEISRVLAMSI